MTYGLEKITTNQLYTRIEVHIPGPKTHDEAQKFQTAKEKEFKERYNQEHNITEETAAPK